MKKYIIWSRDIIGILWWKLLILFRIRRSSSPIPKGVYCYASDIEKNKNKNEDDFSHYIKLCKYYKFLGHGYNGCSYLGIITDDSVFGDQCKMCGKNKYD